MPSSKTCRMGLRFVKTWLQDMRLQGLVLAVLCLLMLLLQCSISWALLCICELLLFHYIPRRRNWVDVVLGAFPCLVVAVYVIFAIVQGLPGLNGDILSDLFFAAVAVALLVCQRRKTLESLPVLPAGPQTQAAEGDDRCFCRFWGCCGVLLGISLTAQVLGMLVYLANSSRPAYTESGIAYWCQGEPNASLVVLEPGYLASPGSLYFVQQALAQTTRACTYDPVGTGFSAGHASGFRSDAVAMKDVVDSELAQHEGSDSWLVVVGGHSRGHLTACRFWVDFVSFYERLAVLGFDGSYCGQTGCDTCEGSGAGLMVVRLLVTPIFTLFSGFLRLAAALLQKPLMQAMASRPADLPDYPAAALIQFAEPYFWPRLWRGQSLRGDAWVHSYDGPTSSECSQHQLTSGSPHHLYIDARDVCTGTPRVCAEHMSLISSSWFADIASARATSFVAR
ncbi:unnamed protein product [Effrenium voratum]|uniref:Uncharacterized protein n=1 Tax=Effrenium voratum TaxID=2562239 RepID=A0AA36JK84_9DINO|nr:unnamed protein product [Effrenium voratum]CAJ1449218.1 unnamed protein product [Effrenium voratum]